MKSKIINSFILICLFYSCFPFSETYDEGYRNGSESGILINEGSLVGSWEKTYEWKNVGGESYYTWIPVDVKYSDNYVFLEDGTFTSSKNINNCLESSGTYSVNGTKLQLIYNCEPGITEEVLIDEFFFREKYIVFIQEDDTTNISKFELVK